MARCKTFSSDIYQFISSCWRAWNKLFLCLVLLNIFKLAQESKPPRYGNPDGVCGDIDIRNDVKQFQELENCSVIEGSLQISLIERVDPREFDKLHFPKLVEVMDYVLIYRVQGFRTLRHIFPNLAVIRGQSLAFNYALVAYENPHLEELGLVNLTTIMRGAVRLENNPNLCYVDTVDWGVIAKSVKPEDHYIKQNKRSSECYEMCPENCPETEWKERTQLRCWTVHDCQKDCSHCDSGVCQSSGGLCCPQPCIGSCTGVTSQDCTVCRNVIYAGICQHRCPPNTYMYKERRCILPDECERLRQCRPRELWRLIEASEDRPATCQIGCPNGYMDNEHDPLRCVKCRNKCPKVCITPQIDSVNAVQRLKGCTYIEGSLILQIIGESNIAVELEKNLGDIEEVRDYIQIIRSFPLQTLHFFKSLRVIHGKNLVKDKYSLFIFDNHNLQKLFKPEIMKNLKMPNGLPFVHFNRKLCYSEIIAFVDAAKIKDKSKIVDMDISLKNNGDLAACSVNKLVLEIFKVSANMALFSWTNFKGGDTRYLISYVINYREATSTNMTVYQGRDACDSPWKSMDVSPESDEGAMFVVHYIVGLKPHTVYAVYVETFMISGANEGAMSDIMYFRTEPDVPTKPENVRLTGDMKGELTLKWEPPNDPRGYIDRYEIYWRPQNIRQRSQLENRNFCKEVLILTTSSVDEEDELEEGGHVYTNASGQDTQCCSCDPNDKGAVVEKDHRARQLHIEFENFIQNSLFKKRSNEKKINTCMPASRRLKRSVSSDPFLEYLPLKGNSDLNEQHGVTVNSTVMSTSSTLDTGNETDVPPKDVFYRKVVVYHRTEWTITNLHHFTEYTIEVMACQEKDSLTNKSYCSPRSFVTARTKPSLTADNINLTTITAYEIRNGSGEVWITWQAPSDPNGLIITYEIKYWRKSVENIQPYTLCIGHQVFKHENGHRVDGLEPGNYSYSLRSRSLAGYSDWTDIMYFNVREIIDDSDFFGTDTIIGLVFGVLFLLIFTVVIVWFVARNKFGRDEAIIYASVNPEYVQSIDAYFPDKWEVDCDSIQLLGELGQGSFGMVYEGRYKETKDMKNGASVAIKTLNKEATMYDRRDFLKEATNMKQFKCDHVVRLIGVVSKTQPTYVIMELMHNGDLKNYLRKHRPDEGSFTGNALDIKQKLQMAGEIADGMAYLTSKKFVHRDLAARNCMVDSDLTVKIGDFGMTRDIYETDYYRKGGKGLLPVRWMSPESLKDGVYTSLSDVWSFGVVLWEMATLAAQPYQGLANEQVLKYIVSRNIMERPEDCPDKLFDLMLCCWRYRAEQRPSFLRIIEMLIPDLDPSFKDKSFFFSEENHPDSNAECVAHEKEAILNCEIPQLCPLELDDDDDSFTDFDNIDYRPRTPTRRHKAGDYKTNPSECECVVLEETNLRRNNPGSGNNYVIGNNNNSHNNPRTNSSYSIHRNSNLNSPSSSHSEEVGAVGFNPPVVGGVEAGQTEGNSSKDSSKSSSSSYVHQNGLVNGHIAVLQTTNC